MQTTVQRGHDSSLTFVCPKTKRRGPAGILTDVETLRKFWKRTLDVECQHCGEVHTIGVRDAFLDSAMDGTRSDV